MPKVDVSTSSDTLDSKSGRSQIVQSVTSVDVADREPRDRVDVRSHVPALLTRLGSKVALHAARLSARKFDMELTEWRVVQILGSEGRSSILNVAKLMSNDPGGVSRSVARLEDRGFISRKSDKSDRRKSFVELTEEGTAFYEKISRFALEREERLLRHLTPAECSELRRVLKTLIVEIDQMLEEGQANRPA